MNKILKDHIKPFSIIIVILFLCYLGFFTKGGADILAVVLIFVVLIIVFILLSMGYCCLFLFCKGLFVKSENIKFGSILPWLDFMSTKDEVSWQQYDDRIG